MHETSRLRPLAAAALAVAAGVVCLIPVLGMPLDRDLAAYGTIGQQLGEGLLPYRDLFDHKQPLVYAIFWALDVVAPQSVAAVRLATAVAAGLCAWLVWEILRPRVPAAHAVVAAAGTLLLCTSGIVEGTGLNTEQLLSLTSAAAVALALRASPWAPGLAGAALGLAVLSKANGVLVAPGVLVLVWATHGTRRATVIAAAAAGGLLVVAGAVLAAAIGLGDLVYANLTYNQLYVGDSLSGTPTALTDNPEMAVLGCGALALGLWQAARTRDPVGVGLLLWLAGAFGGALVSGHGFAHYFAPVVAPAACTLAYWAPRLAPATRRPVAVVLALVVVALAGQAVARFPQSSLEIQGAMFGDGEAETWRDAQTVGERLRDLAQPGDRAYVVGSEPTLHWASGVRPASRYFYTLPVLVTPERWWRAVEDDLCPRLPRFVIRLAGPPSPEPECLAQAPYRERLRHGRFTVFELPRRG